eukprot:Nitzschia sp. Nitz4//scaffold336_size18528//7946//9457//NITZ4_FADS//-1//CDS//3329548301//7280//frame0
MCKDLTPTLVATKKAPIERSSEKGSGRLFDMCDVALSAKESSSERLIVVHNDVYDVAAYLDLHPGGYTVLRDMIGKDCTDAFDCYHRHNSSSRFIIKRYKVGSLREPLPVPAHVQDFRDLREQLIKEGAFETTPAYFVLLKVWLVVLFLAALSLSRYSAESSDLTYYVRMAGAALMGLFWQQLAGLGHDSGHSSVSNDFVKDHEFGSKWGCFFGGISTGWWKRNHNTHHVVCNSIESDPNIQHLPLFTVSEKIMEQPYQSTYSEKKFAYGKLAHILVSYQHWLFFPVMAVARFNLYAQSYRFLTKRQLGMTYFRTEELWAMGGFATWVFLLCLSMSSAKEAIHWLLFSHAVAGILHVQIVLSHFSMYVYKDKVPDNVQPPVDEDGDAVPLKGNHALRLEEDDWYQLQLKTSLDVDCHPLADWFHFGLQFQTTHHIYPALPRPNLRRVSSRIREVCKKHDIKYYSLPFFPALYQTVQVLYETAMLARTGKHCNDDMIWEAMTLQG